VLLSLMDWGVIATSSTYLNYFGGGIQYLDLQKS
jgi:hypothetical protein